MQSEFYSNDRVDSFEKNSSIHNPLDFECPSLFTKYLWDKISISTKKHLIENDFVIPRELTENYRYYKVHDSNLVIDFDSIIGSGIRFGQNLETKEFLAFKKIGSEKDPQVIALKNLKRLRGLIVENKKFWMAMELIDGVTLTQYNWKIQVNNLNDAIKLALSYLDELEFVARSNVNQSDQDPGNTMIDLKKKKVFLIDFSGLGTFNYQTLQFKPDPLQDYLSVIDLSTLITLLPQPNDVEKNALTDKYNNFYTSLRQRRSSEERNKTNFYYFNFTIQDLRKELSDIL